MSLLHQFIIKNAYIFFSEIHIVLHYKCILLKNRRKASLGYKIHMMCNETHEEQIQYSYAATVKHEYRNFKPKKLMIPSDNTIWLVILSDYLKSPWNRKR